MDSGELYERSLSIRYCYPRLLQSKMKQTIVEEEEEVLIDRLPSEIWLHIFGYVHEQDIRNFVFAYPQFQLLKIFWEAKEKQHLKSDPYQPKFIPTIHVQYGSRTLFRFSDADFFYQHVNACCRVAAVYAFFLLGHSKDSQTYTVRYDRNTQQTCEVNMEQLLADAFYNRNCYGSLYRVKQKDENKREPMIDLDHSVDRTYMTNRHQSQFIGQDLLPNLHLILENHQLSELDGHNRGKYEDHFNEQEFLAWQRRHALYDRNEKLVDEYLNANTHLTYRAQCSKDSVLGFREHVFNQIENKSGTSLFRMLSAKDHVIYGFCDCPGCYYQIYTVQDLITIYNHLIFDFDTHRLAIEHLADESSCEDFNSLLYDCVQILQDKVPQENPVSFYRVNIEKLAEVTQGFNHAGCQCQYPTVKVNQFSFLDYTYLSHVHLSVAQNNEHVYVLATYGGIAVL
ncbi:hypothetical protein I4U23_003876 [Adineta vaga]|nr:hypothetical protein I4U23_003876 [Adineta vaga]